MMVVVMMIIYLNLIVYIVREISNWTHYMISTDALSTDNDS